MLRPYHMYNCISDCTAARASQNIKADCIGRVIRMPDMELSATSMNIGFLCSLKKRREYSTTVQVISEAYLHLETS